MMSPSCFRCSLDGGGVAGDNAVCHPGDGEARSLAAFSSQEARSVELSWNRCGCVAAVMLPSALAKVHTLCHHQQWHQDAKGLFHTGKSSFFA